MKRATFAGIVGIVGSTCPGHRDAPAPARPAEVAEPSGPTSRERFDPTPPLRPPGAGEQLFGGSPWGGGAAVLVEARDDGGWDTWSRSSGWQRWDPAAGWIGPEPTRSRPWNVTPHCGNSEIDRLQTELQAHLDRASRQDLPAPDRECIGPGWVSGSRRLCEVDHGVALFEGDAAIARWGETNLLPRIREATWSGDGQQVVWTDSERIVAWRADGAGWTADRPVWHPIWTRDGTLVVATTVDGLAIHDARDGTRLDPVRPGVPHAMVLGPSGEVAAVGSDRTLRIWDPAGRPLGEWQVPAPALTLTWGGDGVCVATHAESVCSTATGAVLSRREVPPDAFAVGSHVIVPTIRGFVVDRREEIRAEPGFYEADPSGDRLGLRRDGVPLTVDLRSGATHDGPLDDWIEPGIRVERGGRSLSVRPDDALVVVVR